MYEYAAQPIYSPLVNPYLTPQGQPVQTQRQEVVKVNGYQGAQAYPMGPNSSALLLDVSGTMIWAATTDGAGYKSVKPFDIAPHEDAPPPDFAGLDARLTKLEEMIYSASTDTATAGRADQKPADRPARGDQAGHR